MRQNAQNRLVLAGDSLRRMGVYPFLLGLLGILLLVQVIRLIWLVATPLGPVGAWQGNEVQVMPPQSRLSLFSSFDPFFRAGPAATGNVVTSLQLTLYGIRTNSGSGLGSAILAGPDGVQESYAIGDEIMSGVTLASVQFDHVTVDRGGVKESLYLDQSVPAETVGTGPVALDRSGAITPSSEGLTAGVTAAIAEAVQFAPRREDGKITGIVLAAKGDETLFQSAGFRDGDVITAFNGQQITSAADFDVLKNQMARGVRISIELERSGSAAPVVIDLEGQ